MDSPDTARPARDDAVSPRQTTLPVDRAMQHALRNINNPLNSHTLDMRADPDAQATVTDFLDFTEYLPSDMMRSLTLIGNLDQTYVGASTSLDDLTSQWGQLPTMSPAERPRPVELRAQISEKLHQTVSSRVYAHAEAVRMSENLNRHYNRIKVILSKLETMLENYPDESEIKSPVATAKSPQTGGTQRLALRMDGQRVRRPHIPRITIPGEVLAPYELNYDAFSSEEDISEGDEEDEQEERAPASRTTPDGPTRIKLIKSTSRPPKPSKVPKPRTSVPPPNVPGGHSISTSSALAQLKPPPENVIIGSSDAPWGQLTPYELAKLRKRMKKNVSWTPSDTMVARELFTLKRGVDAFNAAKQKAEEEGKPFEGKLPVPIVDPVTGEERMPLGSLSLETLADEKNLSNRGMKLNEAKKLKREMLAKMAAEEAEESAKTFKLIAQTLMNGGSHNTHASQAKPLENKTPVGKTKPPPKKRKRDSAPEADAEKPELADGQAQRPQFKRTKTETPVPPPQLSASTSQVIHETPVQPPQRPVVHSTTPIPLPVHAQDQSITAKSGTSVASATSPAPSSNAGAGAGAGLSAAANTTLVPLKLPGAETPIPPPQHSPKKMTPIYPPVRETRKSQATRVQEQQQETGTAPLSAKPVSRGASPASLTPKPDPDNQSTASGPTATTTPNGAPAGTTPSATTTTTITRRPASRGKAGSQEPVSSLASERQRRTSTARNTPAPEPRPSSRRSKRPPPGAISRTVSGGNSAVGKRKAAPKKKSRGKASKDSKVSTDAEEDVEIDDEGNVIDPSEPRYCTCNGVSYGTMIQCDNVENCKHEWFHIDCVGLSDLPARTTKWYCPDCRVLLNIGEKGEVTARGVKA